MFDVMGMANSPEGQAFLKGLAQQFQSGGASSGAAPQNGGFSGGWQQSAQPSSLMDQGFNKSPYDNGGFQSPGMAPAAMPSTGMVGSSIENFGNPADAYDPSNDIARGQMIRQGGRGGGGGYAPPRHNSAFMGMPSIMKMSMSSRSQARREQEQERRRQQLQASSPGLLGRQPRQGGLLGMMGGGASGAYQKGLRQRR